MKCPYCLGTSFSRGRYELAQVVNLQPVLIQNVPAQKCRQCGYLQVSATTLKRIEKILDAGLPDTHVPTAVYDLASQPRRRGVAFTPTMRPQTAGTAAVV